MDVAFLSPQHVLPRKSHFHRPTSCNLPRAVYLSPANFDVNLESLTRRGNFGAVFFGRYSDANSQPAAPVDVVIKCPVDSDLGRQLYAMEKHTNEKLTRNVTGVKRFPQYLGELIVPSGVTVAGGLVRMGLVWRQQGTGETLEDYFLSSRLPELASVLQTTARASPLRRELAAVILRELALMLQSIQASGIVHRDVKPENILLVANDPENAPLKVIDFGSSCDWNTLLKMGLKTATCDPVYVAPEKRLERFRPPYRFDVYSIALIALRAALPSLTTQMAMSSFVNNVLSKARFSLSKACQAVRSGRIQTSTEVATDLKTLEKATYEDLYAVLCTMLTETPEERADVSDCLNSRLLRSRSMLY